MCDIIVEKQSKLSHIVEDSGVLVRNWNISGFQLLVRIGLKEKIRLILKCILVLTLTYHIH